MSVGAPGKRPAIRLKAMTPPRTTEGSVVVRRHSLPVPRPPMRRVLQIVADDESPDSRSWQVTAPMTMPASSASDSHARAIATPVWKRPAVVLVVLAAVGTALGVTLAIASSRFGASVTTSPSSVAQARSDLRSTSEPQPTPVETARASTPRGPDIPTLDVKSLPPAR